MRPGIMIIADHTFPYDNRIGRREHERASKDNPKIGRMRSESPLRLEDAVYACCELPAHARSRATIIWPSCGCNAR